MGPKVFMEVPLLESLPPIIDLNVLGDFTPSRPSYIVGPSTFPFNAPTFFWTLFGHLGPLLLTLVQEYFPPLGLLDGNAKVFHFPSKVL